MKIKVAFVDFWKEEYVTHDFENRVRAALAGLGELEVCTAPEQQPDFVFCSCFGNQVQFYGGTRVQIIGENQIPDFNLYDYAIGCHDLSFGDRYLRLPYFTFHKREAVGRLALEKHTLPLEVYESKQKFCSFVVSNYGANPLREQVFESLSAYKRVESGGRSRNNQPDGRPVEDKLVFQQQCRFSMAFENARTAGYCTEKIVDGFAAATVPIYWGDPEVTRLYNPEAFIDCGDCATVREMVEKVRAVEEDHARWLYMVRQPAYRDEAWARSLLLGDPLGDFIRYIVEQGGEKSRRRSPDFWGGLYEEKARQTARLQRQFWWKYYTKGERFLVRKGIWKK